MPSKTYVVKGAYVTAPVSGESGTVVLGFQRGAPLPDSVPKDTIDHLLSVDLITEKADEVDPFAPPATVDALGRNPVESSGKSASSSSSGDEAPAKSAPKAEWVDHAVKKGMAREDAEAATTQQLQDKYGG
jgi:hypothetical protein